MNVPDSFYDAHSIANLPDARGENATFMSQSENVPKMEIDWQKVAGISIILNVIFLLTIVVLLW